MPFFGLFDPPNIQKLKEKRNVSMLIKLMIYGKDPDIQLGAAIALGEIGDPRAIEPLISAGETIGNYQERLGFRNATIDALGNFQDIRVINYLIGNLRKGRNESIKEALVKIGSPAIEPLIDSMKDSGGTAAAEVLGKIGAPAVKPIVKRLKEVSHSSEARDLVKALGLCGVEALETLVEVLKKWGWEYRGEAAHGLGVIGDPRAFEPLAIALQDEASSYVRNEAAEALGKIGDARAIELLIPKLQDLDSHVRNSAFSSLEKLGADLNTEPIASFLKQRQTEIITFMVEYRVNASHIGEFEDAYRAEGTFGRIFIRTMCMKYALYKDKKDPSRYIVTHTWRDRDSFSTAQQDGARAFTEFIQSSAGWVSSTRNLQRTSEKKTFFEKQDEYELLSEKDMTKEENFYY